MELTPVQIINTDSNRGKFFIQEIEKLLNIGKNAQGDKLKIHKTFNENEIPDFFGEILKTEEKELQEIYKDLKIKRVSLFTFGRKVGYVHKPLNIKDFEESKDKQNKKEEKQNNVYFRFILHLGSPEAYYLTNSNYYEKPFALKNGYGFIVSPLQVENTSFTVYNNHIRLIDDPKVQSEITKIRPLDYKRTVLIYDLEFEIKHNTEEKEEIE
jgi:hypothetical protein